MKIKNNKITHDETNNLNSEEQIKENEAKKKIHNDIRMKICDMDALDNDDIDNINKMSRESLLDLCVLFKHVNNNYFDLLTDPYNNIYHTDTDNCKNEL
jgi:hypothetical protein